MRRLLVMTAATLLVAACGSQVEPRSPATTADARNSGPPPLVLHLAAGDLALDPYASCWSESGVGRCSDGAPPEVPEDVGSPRVLDFDFDATGWDFSAQFVPEGGGRCVRSYAVEAAETGSGTYRLPAGGPAGRYRVEVFGTGPEGDVATTFAWTTPEPGILASPVSTLGIVWEDDNEIQGIGVLLHVDDLIRTPVSASARITATAANGRHLTFDAGEPHLSCPAQGSVTFSGLDSTSQQVAELGPAPFTYDVQLTLDGRTYDGTGRWPDDAVPNTGGDVTLTFTPGLPAL